PRPLPDLRHRLPRGDRDGAVPEAGATRPGARRRALTERRMSAHRIAAFGAVSLAVLAACKAGPDYQPQEPAVAPSFEQAAARPAVDAPGVVDGAAPPPVEWWSTLHDAELDSLIARATAGNLPLQQAKSRIREARARLAGAGAELTPKVSASAGYAYVDSGDG